MHINVQKKFSDIFQQIVVPDAAVKQKTNIPLNCPTHENAQNAKREIDCLLLILQQFKQNHSTLTFLRELSSESTTEKE
jgi:hypothetical protein